MGFKCLLIVLEIFEVLVTERYFNNNIMQSDKSRIASFFFGSLAIPWNIKSILIYT